MTRSTYEDCIQESASQLRLDQYFFSKSSDLNRTVLEYEALSIFTVNLLKTIPIQLQLPFRVLVP